MIVSGATEFDVAALQSPAGLAPRYRRSWILFARWCLAAERRVLPATAMTVAEYLEDNPAANSTQRARLAAINQAHSIAGLPAPGRAVVLRQALNDRYAELCAGKAARVERLLPRIPEWGWTRGLVGRRNAALLVLAASGLSYVRIASLKQGELTLSRDVAIVGPDLATITATHDPYRCPVAALGRWAAVLRLVPTPAGRAVLEHHLTHRTLPEAGLDPRHTDLPLFTSFDRRGWSPAADSGWGDLQPLSETSVAAIVATHLRGQFPKYRSASGPRPPANEPSPPPAHSDIILADNWEAGVTARLRDHQRLSDIGEKFDEIDAETDRIARLLANALAMATT
ncbi:hypothetical protein [Nocardia sp. NBC_01327]|uniref:hypothetical protein n=1 Tax=Nocardia sp. NBC_01327 TaxID=2903593 RepID=UPI002E10C5DA|nr:hypothetical protein OG326_42660 [Nocardia sp. NBC_01327]